MLQAIVNWSIHNRVVVVVLAAYSIAGFFWARLLFLRAQDVHWTGGTVAMPDPAS